MDERGGVLCGHGRISGERRKDARHACAVRPMAVAAELRVTEPTSGDVGRRRRLGRDGPRRCFRPIGGQCLQIRGDGHQIVVGNVLRREMYDLGHAAGYGREAVLAGLEQLDHVLDGPHIAQIDRIPVLDLRAGDVQPALPAGVAHCLLLESQAARRMARPAVSEPLDKIGAAVPQRVLLRIGLERRRVEEDGIPVRQPEAEAKGEAHLGRAVRLLDGGKPLAEVGPERAHVLFVDLGEGGIGHCRVEAMAVPRHALAHGPVESAEGPAADPGLRVRRDVGRPNRPERRLEREAAGHGRSALPGVAGDAVAHLGEVSPTLDERRIDRDRSAGFVRLDPRRHRDPCHAAAHDRGGNRCSRDNSLRQWPIFPTHETRPDRDTHAQVVQDNRCERFSLPSCDHIGRSGHQVS